MDVNDVMQRKRTSGGFGGFWKSQLVELSPGSGEDGWLSFARGGLGQVSHEIGGRWQSQNRKNVYLSPYVEEPLNSKVIKKFVPEQSNRELVFFLSFGIPMLYMNILWTLYVRFTYPYLDMLHKNPDQGSSVWLYSVNSETVLQAID